jgi:hypothetical protein
VDPSEIFSRFFRSDGGGFGMMFGDDDMFGPGMGMFGDMHGGGRGGPRARMGSAGMGGVPGMGRGGMGGMGQAGPPKPKTYEIDLNLTLEELYT